MIFFIKNALGILVFSLFCIGLLPSCVSKKKSLAAIELQRSQFETKETEWRTEEKGLRKQIETLNLQLAENKGETKALWEVQRKLEDRILEKESEIDNISVLSDSRQVQLDSVLRAKSKIIELQKTELSSIYSALRQHDNKIFNVQTDMQAALQAFQSDIEYESRNGNLHIIFAESLLFRANSESTKIILTGETILQEMAQVLEKHPDVKATIVGHTDNLQAKRYKSNWDYSVMRASSVCKMLTDDIGFSPNQVLVAGKSEFEPRASNATSSGRALNRRIEVIIVPQVDYLYKVVKQ